jgi:hypothetical protein
LHAIGVNENFAFLTLTVNNHIYKNYRISHLCPTL